MTSFRILTVFLLLSLLAFTLGCSGNGEESAEQPQLEAQAVESEEADRPVAPPVAKFHYVLDEVTSRIYEIKLEDNTISNSFSAEENLEVIAYDAADELLYKGYSEPDPGLEVFDPNAEESVERFDFPEPVSDMLFHPINRYVYIVSEDSTRFIAFSCDSMAVVQNFPIHVVDKGFVGPKRIQPGPIGKVITANGARASLTQVFTDSRYMVQTVTIKEAQNIDYAVFTLDGNSSFSLDTDQGILYKVRFGTGEMLGQKEGLQRPRHVQIEVMSNTVVLVVEETEILMLHPETFTEMGRVDLAEQGDEILSLDIPPKANFAEVVMDYKGVTRWLRFDIKNWELIRLVELI